MSTSTPDGPSVAAVARALAKALSTRAPGVGRAVSQAARDVVRARSAPPTGATELTVEVITDADHAARLASDWDALHTASGARSGFTSWPWLRAWWAEIEHPHDAELRLYVARSPTGAVAGIGPTYRTGRILRLLGDTRVGSEHLDVLAAPADRPAAAGAIAAAIARDDALDGLELVDLAEGSSLGAALADQPWVGLRDQPWQTLPYLPLPGSAAAWEAGMSSSMRYNVRRKLKRLAQRHPGAALVVVAEEDALPGALAQLFELHGQRWETKGQTGNFVRDDVRAFHRRAAPALLERGLLRLYRLDVGAGRTAAMLYCLRSGGRELYLQAGLDPAFEEVSAGFCLMAQVIARAADEGVTEFDFLRGTEGYKTHWATAERTTRRITAARPTARGLAWLARTRGREEAQQAVKAAVPAAWWAQAKAWAGQLERAAATWSP